MHFPSIGGPLRCLRRGEGFFLFYFFIFRMHFPRLGRATALPSQGSRG
jgi:hypothetical protein